MDENIIYLQITHLSQITSEVGQCRAWIRLALNDCLLSSYLLTLRRDPSALKSYYRPTAYVRDMELLEVAQRLIEGIEAFKSFTIPCNSSLLNSWQLPSLYLAGIWAPTLKSCPIAPCDDVAQLVDESARSTPENLLDSCSLSSAMSIASQNSGLRQMLALNEDEALKIILAKHKDNNIDESVKSDDEPKTALSDSGGKSNDSEKIVCNLGNSLSGKTGWSFDETQQAITPDTPESESNNPTTSQVRPEPKSMEGSYNALIESHNMLRGSCIKPPDLKEIWSKFESQKTEEKSPSYNNNVSKVLT